MVTGLLLTLLTVATQAPFAGISSSLCLLVLLAVIRVNLRNSVSLGSVALSVTSLSSTRIRYDPIMFVTLRFIDIGSKSEGSQLWLLASCLLLTTFVHQYFPCSKTFKLYHPHYSMPSSLGSYRTMMLATASVISPFIAVDSSKP